MTESLPAPLLPLTPFETLMWRDDRPGYPMVFAVKAELRGEVNRNAFINAARQAAERHPLLHSIVVHSQGCDCWRQLPSAAPEIVWLAEQATVPPELWQGLNINQRGGLRLIVQATAQGSRVLLQYHHACTDGVGGLNYFGDLLGYYHAALTGHLPRELSKPAETELLTQRGTLFPPEATTPVEQPPPAPPASWWSRTIATLRDSWNFATYRAAA
ncbi:MAG TPA: hypothetical protein VL096_02780, partial [Pirellulaceae bacterium]|nr:hypothetical protein [Pirellulaceae bacterium]